MKTTLRILGILWSLCWAIPIWLVYILPLWLVFRDLKFMGWDGLGIAIFTLALADPTVEPWHACLWSDWYGVGLPCAYIYRDEPGVFDDEYVVRIKKHEKKHVLQWFALGPFFPLVYVVGGAVAELKGGDAYEDNPLEISAREAELVNV